MSHQYHLTVWINGTGIFRLESGIAPAVPRQGERVQFPASDYRDELLVSKVVYEYYSSSTYINVHVDRLI